MTAKGKLNLQDHIVMVLYEVWQKDSMSQVRYPTLYCDLQRDRRNGAFSDIEFTAALKYLVEEGYIQERAAYYNLTSRGVNYARNLTNPPPEYSRMSSSYQRIGIVIAVISVFAAVIFGMLNYFKDGGSSPREATKTPLPMPVPVSTSKIASPLNLSGDWEGTLTVTPNYPLSYTLSITQEGSRIEGISKSFLKSNPSNFANARVIGEVTNGNIEVTEVEVYAAASPHSSCLIKLKLKYTLAGILQALEGNWEGAPRPKGCPGSGNITLKKR